jgi:hypothetical protein
MRSHDPSLENDVHLVHVICALNIAANGLRWLLLISQEDCGASWCLTGTDPAVLKATRVFIQISDFERTTHPVRRDCRRCEQTRRDAIFLRIVILDRHPPRLFVTKDDFVFIDQFSDSLETH